MKYLKYLFIISFIFILFEGISLIKSNDNTNSYELVSSFIVTNKQFIHEYGENADVQWLASTKMISNEEKVAIVQYYVDTKNQGEVKILFLLENKNQEWVVADYCESYFDLGRSTYFKNHELIEAWNYCNEE
ncbi:hypothetical protein KMW28_23255 [Flammeovirga yaeyamensis]|uniref:Uncharacterized protein n=1 Tax=Flammeovirga yaeyamensis TaxID=367791 RepID=A0AAX1NDL0_9BACT|nr:hypothetical protein [Flammeovirga yaeyamensis]MBB3696713.1 hypothetical protein [Flammeovirga yaeyamensis]NMF33383.1 hypothetical protein [Flammeovirga yaeyamensis]QWG05342.1 hypothetical protein KMW28_23255 [Flammeovirga yaeyamensis]